MVGAGRGRELHRLGDPRVPGRDPPGPARRRRRDRGRHARGRRASSTPTASRSSARSTRSTGTRTPPRRAATRPSCSRRSTSRPTPSPRRSPTGWPATTVELGDIGISDDELRDLRRVVIVACGTSYHAGLVGRYAIEEWARVPVEMDIASEFRYRNPVLERARPRDRHLAVGRDRRHAGGHAPGPRARRQGARDHQRHGQPGHARRRRRAVHPRGPRDRRGRDQDLRGPGRRRCTCSR